MPPDPPPTAVSSLRQRAEPSCYLCGAEGSILYRDLPDRAYGIAGRWSMRRCPRVACGLVWMDPVPVEADIALAYQRYFTHRHMDAGRAERPADGGLALRLLRAGLGLRRDYRRFDGLMLDDMTPGRLLEIGFGDAARLRAFAQRGWAVEGQELDPVAITQARRLGLRVHAGVLEELRLPAGAFDAVIASHVIEHVHDPIRLLALCRRLLAPDGRLVLLTPSEAGYGVRRFGPSWVGFDPPRHLYLFSARTLTRIAQRAGLTGIHVISSSARAAPWYLGALQVELTGRYRLGRHMPLSWRIQAAAALVRALQLQRRGLVEGEELMLRASA